MDLLIGIAGIVAATYIFFQFITDGDPWLAMLGIIFIGVASVSAMNAFPAWVPGERIRRAKRKK